MKTSKRSTTELHSASQAGSRGGGRRRLPRSLPAAKTKRVKTKPSTEPAKLVVEDEEIIESLAVEVSIHVCMPFRMQRNDLAPEN